MTKLCAGVCFYEKSLPTIQRCIESIKSHVEVIFAIDGRFTDELGHAQFPDTEPLSPDYIKNYLQSIPNVVYVPYPATEIQKRQMYCEMAKQYECEYLLIIDSDEFVLDHSDWQTFRQQLDELQPITNIHGIKFQYGYPNHTDSTNYPRLWRNAWEMEYFHAHCLFRNKITGKVSKSSSAAGPLVEGIIMAGDDSLRDRSYQIQSFEYQSNLILDEQEIREKYQHG